MKLNLGISRRSIAIAVASLAAVISLGLGANAALNKISHDTREAIRGIGGSLGDHRNPAVSSRVALVIGNGRYPDAREPLTQPVNDARAFTAALRQEGFDVDIVEDGRKDDMHRAVDRLKAKVRRDTVVVLFYSGYGIQAARESYMIPVDAAIWKEGDVRRQGISVERVLSELKESGARANLVVLDASRRNPYERRFRTYSRGLESIDAPQGVLILSSATPGKVVDEEKSVNSILTAELLRSMARGGSGAEQIFNRTRIAVSRNTDGQQVPTVSSSLVEDVRFGRAGG